MSMKHLDRTIREVKSSKNSTDDIVEVAKHLWSENYGPTSDGIKRKELEEELKEKGVELEYTISTSLEHLREAGLVRRWIKGPQILVIHEDEGVVNGEDLDDLVDEEIRSLVQAMEDQDPPEGGNAAVADGGDDITIRDVVSSALEVESDQVEAELRKGDVPNQMSKLESAIEAIENSPVDKNGEYYQIFFIHNPYRYSLTARSINLCEK